MPWTRLSRTGRAQVSFLTSCLTFWVCLIASKWCLSPHSGPHISYKQSWILSFGEIQVQRFWQEYIAVAPPRRLLPNKARSASAEGLARPDRGPLPALPPPRGLPAAGAAHPQLGPRPPQARPPEQLSCQVCFALAIVLKSKY